MSRAGRTWAHRTLLALAAGEAPERGHRVEDWEALAAACSAHGMLGWLAHKLRTSDAVPGPIQLQLQAASLRHAGSHLGHLAEAKAALELLHTARVPAMVLKGPALVERYYRDPGVRPYGDVDLYVPPAQLEAALETLTGAGFLLIDRNWRFLVEDLRGQVHLATPAGRTLELHWHRQRLAPAAGPAHGSRRALGGGGSRPPRRGPVSHVASGGGDRASRSACGYARLQPFDLAPGHCGHQRGDRNRLGSGDRRLRRWDFGSGGWMVLSLSRAWLGAGVPDDTLRLLRPGPATRALFEALLRRWDLAEDTVGARARELFMAAAGDSLTTRLKLAGDFIVPAPGTVTSGRWPQPLQRIRRITMGTTYRLQEKFGGRTSNELMSEYRDPGERSATKRTYLDSVTSLLPGAPEPRLHVVVLSPSRSIGMSHYAHAVAEAMQESANVLLLDGARGDGFLRTRRRLKELRSHPEARLLLTSPHYSVPFLLWGWRAGGGFVFHDPILDAPSRFLRPLHVLYYRLLARWLGVVIIHGATFRNHVLRLKLKARRIAIVPHGFVPHQLNFNEEYDPKGPMIFVGRLHAYKGLAVLLKALEELAARDAPVNVVLAGSGIRPELVPSGLACVTVRGGEISDEEFRSLVARCSAVLLPYERANQSGVLATAFRAGRPVIASAVGSFSEYIRHGENGLLVPPGDRSALGAAIEKLASDPGLARRLADGAARSWRQELSPKRCAAEIVRAIGAGSGLQRRWTGWPPK